MTRRTVAFALTIDGCPYAAASLGCPTSITSSYDWPSGAIVLPGTIAQDALARLGWSETVRPTTGDLDVSGLTIALDEATPTSGPAAGYDVWSRMFSRRNRLMRSSQIASAVSATDTSIVVASNPGFTAGAQIIWIDREAINCSSFNAGTKTFTVAAGGRGYLGTRAADHVADVNNAFTPLVWDEFPNPQRRRAILWMVEGGIATPLWRGYVGRAPRLANGGARWELQLDHAWSVQAQRPLGPSRTAARLVGYQPESFAVAVWQLGAAGSTINRFEAITEPATSWTESLEEVCQSITDKLNAQIALASPTITGSLRWTVSDQRPRFDTSLSTFHTLACGPRLASPGSTVTLAPGTPGQASAVQISTGLWTAQASWGYPIRGAHFACIPNASTTLTVDSIAGIPSTGLITTSRDGAQITRVQWVLRGDDEDGFAFHFALTSVNTGTRRVTGVFRPTGVTGTVEVRGARLFTAATPVTIATRVEATHWIYAIRRGALSLSYGLDDQADPRDWSWDTADRIVGATGGEASTSRVWIFDGSTTLGAFIKDASTLDATPVAVRNSLLTFATIDPPLESDAVEYAIDLTAGQGIHLDVPGYSTQPEGVYNAVTIKREDSPSVTVNNQTSIALYGLSRSLEIEAKGSVATIVDGRSPFELARGMLSRVLGLWSEPVELVSVAAPFGALTGAQLCSVASITSKVIPDGAGNRGTSVTRKGRVVGRQIDFASGTVRLEILCYPHRVSGYPAAARVASFGAPSNRKLTLSASYGPAASTVKDYAASTTPDYVGTPNDGGASRWEVGDTVRFRIGNDTSGVEEGGWTISAVDPATNSITLSADPSGGATNWVSLLAGGAAVEVVSDDYNASPALSATQRGYAYAGSRSAGTLNGDPLKEWAP